jgi:hypothetical protein
MVEILYGDKAGATIAKSDLLQVSMLFEIGFVWLCFCVVSRPELLP